MTAAGESWRRLVTGTEAHRQARRIEAEDHFDRLQRLEREAAGCPDCGPTRHCQHHAGALAAALRALEG